MVPLSTSKCFAVASPARQAYNGVCTMTILFLFEFPELNTSCQLQETLKQKSAAWRAERVHLKNEIAVLRSTFEQSQAFYKQTQETTAQKFAALKADYEAKIAENNDSESGLVDHVYQLDQQNKDLSSERRFLVRHLNLSIY
jgi:hypothetical protein